MLVSLKLARGSQSHEAIFVARYADVRRWALQISGQNKEVAEDLVQDAFLHFTSSKPNLSEISNVDAYLYAVIRNLYRTHQYRELRRKQVPIAILEFDSAESGLRVLSVDHRLGHVDDLLQICSFVCERKETAKAASAFILRYFLDYAPRDIARIMQISRDAVDERIRIARNEARQQLSQQNQPGFKHDITRLHYISAGRDAVTGTVERLQSLIFSSCRTTCRHPNDVQSFYKLPGSGISLSFLAHIVSCHCCLDLVNRELGLEPRSERDVHPPDSPGPAGSPDSDTNERRVPLGRWKRAQQTLWDHHAKQLCVVLNGIPISVIHVGAERNQVSLTVTQAEPIESVAIMSEQDISLLLLVVNEPSKPGNIERESLVHLSDGRSMRLVLRDDIPWPTIRLAYDSKGNRRASRLESVEPFADFEAKPRHESRWHEWVISLQRLFSPSFHSPVVMALTLMIFLTVQTRDTIASAAMLLDRSAQWERLQREDSNRVLKRTYALTERQAGRLLHHRRVEVWQGSSQNQDVRRLYDESGILLESVTAPPAKVTAATAWLFAPSSQTFQRVLEAAGQPSNRLTVHFANDSYIVSGGDEQLILDNNDYRPIGVEIHLGDYEFQFVEQAVEKPKLQDSPFAVSRHQPFLKTLVTGNPEVKHPGKEELNAAELESRIALAPFYGITAAPIHFQQRSDAVEIETLVETTALRDGLLSALRDIKNLDIRIRTLDVSMDSEIEARNSKYDRHKFASHSPLLVKYLTQHFGAYSDAQEFISSALDTSRSVIQDAMILRDLARRYDGPQLTELTNDQRTELNLLSGRYVNRIAIGIEKHWQSIYPVLSPLAPRIESLAPVAVHLPVWSVRQHWSARVETLTRDLQQWEYSQQRLFAVVHDDSGPAPETESDTLAESVVASNRRLLEIQLPAL